MVDNNELIEMYRTDFLLQKKHGYTLSELDNMMIYEREINIEIVIEQIEKESKNRRGN